MLVLAHLCMKLNIFPSTGVSSLYLCSVECNPFMSILKQIHFLAFSILVKSTYVFLCESQSFEVIKALQRSVK